MNEKKLEEMDSIAKDIRELSNQIGEIVLLPGRKKVVGFLALKISLAAYVKAFDIGEETQSMVDSRLDSLMREIGDISKFKEREYNCSFCGKKILPSKPWRIVIGKKASFYHKNCIKKEDNIIAG